MVCVMDRTTTPVEHRKLRERVLRVVHRKKTCDTEVLLKACGSYPWNEVFLEIDQLTRSGQLCLFYKQDGNFLVRLPPAA